MRSTRLMTILVLVALVVPAAPARASGVVTVCDEVHLRQALSDGGTVTFGCSGTIILTDLIRIGADTTLDGTGQEIIISGNQKVGVFSVGEVAFNLTSLTIADALGSGIYNDRGTLTVSNSIFRNNSGGGISNTGTLTVINSIFIGNSAGDGGAIDNSGTATVTNSTFSSNSADESGGGINSGYNGTLTVSNSTFGSNSANDGGGISSRGTVTVTNSTFAGNNAVNGKGGGIYYDENQLSVNNSTFVGNSANEGGGIYNENGRVMVSNSTLSDNSAGKGGGIASTSDGYMVLLTNTIVANSQGGDNCDGFIYDGGNNLSFPDTTCPGTNGNPMLGPLQDNGGPTQTMAIGPSSAAKDAVNYSHCADYPVDQRGVTRPQGLRCDIGAYEYEQSPVADLSASDGVIRICDEAHLLAALPNGGMITFGCSGTITLTGQIEITNETTIDGSGQNVTISGNNAVQVFFVNGDEVALNLNNLTIANGNPAALADTTAGDNGGGILIYRATVTVSNSTFTGNSAASGGGGIANYGTLTVSNSSFTNNSAGEGGGIANYGTLTVSNSTFTGNSANSGGGIGNYGTLAVSNSTFTGNSATSSGGAIFNEYGYERSSSLILGNSTFTNNSASYKGGGIHNRTTLSVSNSTFANNSADEGRGIANEGELTMKNTIVADTIAGSNCSGTITDGGGNLSYPDTTCPGINGDPKLGPLQDNGGPTQTMALSPSSAAIDAANDAICAARPVVNRDQRGITRPQGSHCDIGAYEYQGSPTAGSPTTAGTSSFAWLLLAISIVVVAGLGAGIFFWVRRRSTKQP